MKKREFIRKPNNSFLYKWSPDEGITKEVCDGLVGRLYCNALPRSQGEDWITTYVYERIVVDGQEKRLAYVACDYVE